MAEIITGYKATDKDMRCRGFQFELGKWYEHEGEIKLCVSGFHFCKYPSGPWAYYGDPGTRIFKVEAEGVGPEEYVAGSEIKYVCKRIRLIEEVIPDGDRNTGNRNTGNGNTGNGNTGDYNTGNGNTGDYNTGNGNTGDRNTGDGNTGDCNTGDYNTGDYNTGNGNTGDRNTGNGNTGDRNTGDGNTGDRNTGDYNTGDYNTGDCNTGDRNTGDYNTGDRNTGDYNTGNYNTGNYNTTNNCSGFFCQIEPKVLCFDVDTGLTKDQFMSQFPEHYYLSLDLSGDEDIEFAKYEKLPGITPEKLKSLHEKHKAAALGEDEADREYRHWTSADV